MLRAIILIVAFVWVGASVNNGEWGPAALGVVIAVVLLAMGSQERKDTKAYLNWRDYWAKGGPEAERNRRR